MNSTHWNTTDDSSLPLQSRIFRRLLLTHLAKLRHGVLRIEDELGSVRLGALTERCDIEVTLRVHDPAAYRRMALRGSIGAGESYMDGQWSCDDLTGLMRLLVVNRDAMDDLEKGLAWLARPLFQLFHWLHRNTVSGSRRNIAAHYDLSNDFYRLFLDDTMMYSCGVFASADSTLYEASVAKNDLICRKLQLTPDDHLLEIGTGWGGFALHAARNYGCRITTTTISNQQWEMARQRIAEAGLTDRITLLREDYRDLSGRYDKIVSIEMIEAVGHHYYDTYFRKCSELLNDHGMMVLQTITIADQYYERVKHSVDFIQRYIFPGGCLPSVTAIADSLTRVTDFRIFHLDDIGPHYATTLHHWRRRFFDRIEEVRQLGFPERFIRMWEFYLCYCEGGFLERAIGNVQLLLTKPGCRRQPLATTAS
jgi:cyclopropane-fatty-acyl-phospholipid synthase